MDEFFKIVLAEWRVIKGAPISFIAAVLLIAAGMWFVMEWQYRGQIETKDATIQSQNAWLEEYREKAGKISDIEKGKTDKLQKELKNLRTEINATVSFLGPESIKLVGGAYVVKGTMHINATTPKSGLTFGFSTKQFQDFKITSATDLPVICNNYELPKLAELGTHRFHCRNVNGAYGFELKVGAAGPVIIRHRLEGKQEGQVVTWHVSKP